MRLARVGGRVIDLARGFATPPVVTPAARPTGVFAVAGDGDALVYWDDTSTPGQVANVSASTGQVVTGATPVYVPGLSNATAVTFTVQRGANGVVSWPSDPVTPTAGDAGVTYYVDYATGSDSNSGLTVGVPLKTAAKAVTVGLGPGDAVLFKRGSTWVKDYFSTLTNLSGAANRPITVAAYGRGAAPQFEGGDTVTGWTPYVTQPTNPELLTNASIETFGSISGQVTATGWHVFIGGSGGSQSKETTIIDTGSTGSQKMSFAGGTNLFDQWSQNGNVGQSYTWTTRIATDASGASAGVQVRLQVKMQHPDTGVYYYLQADGTWNTSTETWYATVTPTTSFTSYTVAFTAPVTSGIFVQHRSVAGLYSGQSVYVDNNTVKSTAVQPTSSNTYRTPVTRASGNYVGMLWVDGGYRKLGLDRERLADQAWTYDGAYVYYRTDASNPAIDGHLYEVANTQSFVYFRPGTDWIIRDLSFRLYNSGVAGCNANGTNCARLVFAENSARMCGAQQVALKGTPVSNGVLSFTSVDGYATMRGNDLRDCNTDLYYILGTKNLTFTDNVGIRAMGDSADCCQLDDAGGTAQGTAYIARNYLDNRNSPSPKGALLVAGAAMAGSVIEYNTCMGGHFGIGIGTARGGVEVRYNRISEVGVDPTSLVDWAAGIYSDTSGSSTSDQNVHHNLIYNCYSGFNFTNGTRSNMTIAKNTITGCRSRGFYNLASFATSTLTNNVFYDPVATNGENVPSSTSGLAVSGNLVGVDPQFADLTGYIPQAATAAGKGWTAP